MQFPIGIKKQYSGPHNFSLTAKITYKDNKLNVILSESHNYVTDDLETIMPDGFFGKCELIISQFEKQTKRYKDFKDIKPCYLTTLIDKEMTGSKIPEISTIITIMDKYFKKNDFNPTQYKNLEQEIITNQIKEYKIQ